MFCRGVEGEALDAAEADDSAIHPIDLDYKKDDTKDDDEDDATGYTNSGRASLQIIAEINVGAADDDNDNDNNVISVDDDDDDDDEDNDDYNNIYNDNIEKEEKDEAFYQREERALKQATLLAKLRKHIEQSRSM